MSRSTLVNNISRIGKKNSVELPVSNIIRLFLIDLNSISTH